MPMSTMGSIKELQNEVSTLRNEVASLKYFFQSELQSVRKDMHAHFKEERRRFVDDGADSVSHEKGLPFESDTLSPACTQPGHSEELFDAAGDRIVEGSSASANASLVPSTSLARAGCQVADGGDVACQDGITAKLTSAFCLASTDRDAAHDAVRELLPRLKCVFDFYSGFNVADEELAHPAMHYSQFTAMVRDSSLDRGRRPLPPELLWMAAVRDLPPPAEVKGRDRREGSTLLQPKVFDDSSIFRPVMARRDLLVYERLRSITFAEFPRALYVIFCAAVTPLHDAADAPAAFSTFLSETFLPSVERRIWRHQTSRSAYASGNVPCGGTRTTFRTGAPSFTDVQPELPVRISDTLSLSMGLSTVVATYQDDADVQKVVNQFTPHLKRCFRHVVRCLPTCRTEDARMSIAAFLDCARHQHVLPLITRAQLREIFIFCASLSDATRPDRSQHEHELMREVPASSDCETISCSIFTTAALYCLAEQVYGADAPLRQQYPSPCARVSKLLVRMFVL